MRKTILLFALLCASVMGFAIDWSGISWLANSNEKFKVVVNPTGPNIVQEQDWNSKRCIYVTYADANFGDCSLDASLHDTQGAGKFYYTSAFVMRETEFTQVHNGTTYTFTVYNVDGEPEDLTGWNIAKGKTSVAGHNSEGGHAAANDANFGTRWSSDGAQHYAAVGAAAEDWWYVDLGNFYKVNTIKILFETACPNDYDILISNNGASWTVIGTYTSSPKTGNNPATDYNEYAFTDKVGRYVKIFARNGYNSLQYGISMYEFEVYGERATLEDHNSHYDISFS